MPKTALAVEPVLEPDDNQLPIDTGIDIPNLLEPTCWHIDFDIDIHFDYIQNHLNYNSIDSAKHYH